MPVFIFVGGASGAGKTTYARVLKDHFLSLDRTCNIISTDNYWNGKPDSVADDPESIRKWVSETKLDVPCMQDYPLLNEHIAAWSNDQTVNMPIFNFQTSKREIATQIVPPSDYMIIEGIFALTFLNRFVLESRELEIKYFPVFITNDSWRDTVDLRVRRNLGFGFSEEMSRDGEVKNVGPGYLRYTAVQTPGLMYVKNPCVEPSKIIEQDRGLAEMDRLYQEKDANPEYQVPSRFRVTRVQPQEGSFVVQAEEQLLQEVQTQFTHEVLECPLNSREYQGIGRKYKREIIAQSYADTAGEQSPPRFTSLFFPNPLFQSFGKPDRDDSSELYQNESQKYGQF